MGHGSVVQRNVGPDGVPKATKSVNNSVKSRLNKGMASGMSRRLGG